MSAAKPTPPASASLKALRWLSQRPGHSRLRSRLIVTAVVLAIGWVDYISGVRLSLVLFYYIPIAIAVGWLGPGAGCTTAVACIVVRVAGDLAGEGYAYPLAAYWNRLIDLCGYFIMVWILHALLGLSRDLEKRVRQRTSELERANQARNDLQAQLFEISRRERAAIGHELHDGLGQHLTATSMAAKLLARRLDLSNHPAAPDAQTILRLIKEGISKVRQVARGLLLASVEPTELTAELEEMAAALNRDERTDFQVECTGDIAGRVDTAKSSHLFYIAQEAARNIVRHAHARHAQLRMVVAGDDLELMVQDDGRGLDRPAEVAGGLGLRIMAHRAELIGGTFAITPRPGGGTSVVCRVPLAVAAPESVAS